jgi:hypothetical protein
VHRCVALRRLKENVTRLRAEIDVDPARLSGEELKNREWLEKVFKDEMDYIQTNQRFSSC